MSSATSVQSIWSIVNQFQLMITFQLVGWYISPDVQEYINGFQHSSFSFSFIPYFKVPLVSSIYDFFWTTQTYTDLGNVSLNYGSTIANEFCLFSTIFWLIVANFIYLSIRRCIIHKIKKECLIKFINGIGKLFLLAIYIRTIIEAYLFFLISLISEIKAFQVKDISNIVSLVIAFPMLIWAIVFFVFVVFHFLKHRKSESGASSSLLEELYANSKQNVIGRAYCLLSKIIIPFQMKLYLK